MTPAGGAATPVAANQQVVTGTEPPQRADGAARRSPRGTAGTTSAPPT